MDDQLIAMRLERPYRRRRDNPVHVLRSKSAFYVSPASGLGFLGVTAYGPLTVVLKDQVKRRGTWTHDDSYGVNGRGVGMARTFSRVPFLPVASAIYAEAQVWGELDLRDVREFRVPSHSPSAAIWGLLRVEPIPAASLEALKRLGLPIYEYDFVKDGRGFGRYLREPRQVPLFAGDDAKREAYDRPVQGTWAQFLKSRFPGGL